MKRIITNHTPLVYSISYYSVLNWIMMLFQAWYCKGGGYLSNKLERTLSSNYYLVLNQISVSRVMLFEV